VATRGRSRMQATIFHSDQRLPAAAGVGTAAPSCPPATVDPGRIASVSGLRGKSKIVDVIGFASPRKLCGYTGLCPKVYQSGRHRDHRGPPTRNGPTCLRWALIEVAVHAAHHPCYHDHYRATKRRLGAQRGADVARVEVARRLAEVIWHMLTKQEPFAPARPHAAVVA
jgi:transposase